MEIGIPTSAIRIDLAAMVRSETNLKTSYSASWQSYENAIRLIGRHREMMQSMVGVYELENYLAAFEASVRREDLKSVVVFK